MKKAMVIMLIGVAVLFAGVYALKRFIYKTEKNVSAKFQNKVVTVSATTVKYSAWNDVIQVVGSTRTVKGVNVTTELSGMIESIDFTPGADVKKGTVLVKLNIAPDVAKLHQLQAQAMLNKITYQRDKKQYAFGAVSKEQLDTDYANYKSSAASVEEQQAIIAKKIIKAPFTGRLGISQVNPGEYINSGQEVVNLQTLNPIYVDFYLPQQQIQDVEVGETVDITSDRDPGKTFKGKITTINPMANSDIRNVEVEATLANPHEILLPGMFVNINIEIGKPQQYLTLPQMAVTFNPYGAIVFILKKTTQQSDGEPVWQAQQQFVATGMMRGDQVAITKGIKEGDMIATSGQLKLRNDSMVVINNKVSPPDAQNPRLPEQ